MSKIKNRPPCRIDRVRDRRGRCYELAAKGQEKAPAWLLVHGEVNACPQGVARTGHAWLELDGVVHDPVLDLEFSVEGYAFFVGAVEAIRYTRDEAAQRMVESGHYGPW